MEQKCVLCLEKTENGEKMHAACRLLLNEEPYLEQYTAPEECSDVHNSQAELIFTPLSHT